MSPEGVNTAVQLMSRKFILTVFSVLVFPILLMNGSLTGDQFVNVYTLVFGLYVGGNVWAKSKETKA